MTAQKNHISGLLFTYLYGSLGFYFFTLNFVIEKRLMFLHEAEQILRKFLLLRPRNLDNSKKDLFKL